MISVFHHVGHGKYRILRMGRYRYQIFHTGDTKDRSKKKSIPERRIDAFDTARDLSTLCLLSLCSSGHYQRQMTLVMPTTALVVQSWAVDRVLLRRTMITEIFDLFICVVDSTRKYWTITTINNVRQPCAWSTRSRDFPVNSMTLQYRYRYRYRHIVKYGVEWSGVVKHGVDL